MRAYLHLSQTNDSQYFSLLTKVKPASAMTAEPTAGASCPSRHSAGSHISKEGSPFSSFDHGDG